MSLRPAPHSPASATPRVRWSGVLLVVALIATACGSINIELGLDDVGSGVSLTESLDLDLDGISAVEVNDSWNVTVEVGEGAPGVQIEIDDNLRHLVDIRVDDEKLVFSLSSHSFSTEMGFNATVNLAGLSDLRVAGASVAIVNGDDIDLRRIELSGTSAATVRSIAVQQLRVEANGASSLRASGSATVLDVDANGASEALLFDLSSTTVTIGLSGASTGEVQATDEVTGEASGASGLTVDGGASIRVETSGGSSVDAR